MMDYLKPTEFYQIKDLLKKMTSFIEDLYNGKGNFTKLCGKYQLNYGKMKRFISTSHLYDTTGEKADLTKFAFTPDDLIVDPDELLARDLLGIRGQRVVYIPPKDIEISVKYLLESIGITSSSKEIMQNQNRSELLKPLYKSPKTEFILRYGLAEYNSLVEYNERVKKSVEDAKKFANRVQKDKEIDDIKRNLNKIKKIVIESCTKNISVLNLNTKCYNIMHKYFIEKKKNLGNDIIEISVFDVISLTNEDLIKINNCGPASIRNIKDQVNQYLSKYNITRDKFLYLLGRIEVGEFV